MKHLRSTKIPLLVIATTVCCLLATGHNTQQAELAAATTTSSAATSARNEQQEITTTGSSVITNLFREQATRPPSSIQQQQQQQRTTSSESAVSEPEPESKNTVEQKVPTTTTTILGSPQPVTTTTSTSITTTTEAKQATQRSTTNAAITTTNNQYQYVRPNSASVVASVSPAPKTTTISSTNSVSTQPPTTPAVSPKTQPQPMCFHNNQSYAIGQRWNEDCLQVCDCVKGASDGEALSACRPRCPTYVDAPGDNCKLLRSKQDECCLEWSCELDAKFAPNFSLQPTTITTTTNTESGPVGMITTDIKMPTIAAAVSTPSPKMTTTTAAATTTTTSTTTTAAPTTTNIQSSRKPASVQQAPVTSTAAASITSRSRQPPTTMSSIATIRQSASTPPSAFKPSANSRAPKQVPDSNDLYQASGMRPIASTGQWQSDDSGIGSTSSSAMTTTMASSDSALESEKEIDPLLLDLCILSTDAAYRLNESWPVEPCNRTCRCVFKSELRDMNAPFMMPYATINMKPGSPQTEIRCSLGNHCGGFEAKLANALECPSPRIQLPSSVESCACPQVTSCGQRKVSPTPTTLAAMILPETTPKPATGCRKLGPNGQLLRQLAFGQSYKDECHSICHCANDGEIRCEELQCPQVSPPPADEDCQEYHLDPNFEPSSRDNKCCPQFVCKRPVESSPTTMTTPTVTTGASSLAPVLSSSTIETTTIDGEPIDSERSGKRACLLLGKELKHDERVPDEMYVKMLPVADDSCADERVCSCQDGKITCSTSGTACPSLAERPPFDCPAESSIAHQVIDDGACCPRWLCEPYSLVDFQVVPMNASSVEVISVLPLFAMGRRGRIELKFANVSASSSEQQPPVDPRMWFTKPKIKTADGILSHRVIKYYLDSIRPNRRYWFKMSVRFDDEQEPSQLARPLESQLQTIVMPSLHQDDLQREDTVSTRATTFISTSTAPTTTTTTTTTTTSTPPTIILKPPTTSLTPIRQHPPSTSTVVPSTTTTTSTTSTTTTSTTTSTTTPAPVNEGAPEENKFAQQPVKPDPLDQQSTSTLGHMTPPPCNDIDAATHQQPNGPAESRISLPWTYHMNAPLHKYAWHLLCALSVMTVLFVIVSYLYLKKSVRVIAPITSSATSLHHSYHSNHSSSAYDNPTFTKLVSYYANQPHVLLVDESSQNYDNDVIMAKQKNLEVDKSSPLAANGKTNNNTNNHNNKRTISNNNHHPPHQIHHNGGRQNLI